MCLPCVCRCATAAANVCVRCCQLVCVAMLLPMCVCRTPEDLLLMQPCVNLLCYCCCQRVYTDAAAWVCVPCVCGCIILAAAAILCLLFTVIQLLPMCVCRVLCRVCAVVYLLLLQPCVNPLCSTAAANVCTDAAANVGVPYACVCVYTCCCCNLVLSTVLLLLSTCVYSLCYSCCQCVCTHVCGGI